MNAQILTRLTVVALSLTFVSDTVRAQSGAEAKDIFEKGINVVPGAGSGTAALKYDVLLQRGEREEAVATSRRFVDGDKFKLRFEVNHDSYVYVLHRTLDGNPDQMERYTGTKGIRTIHEEDRSSHGSGKYRLLYPARNTGEDNLLRSRRPTVVPEGGRNFFQMDNDPGIEKLVVVVSPKPVDIARLFNLTTERGNSNDSDPDIDNQLKGAVDNTVDSKGICVAPCSEYAAPRASGKPILVNVDLRHYRR